MTDLPKILKERLQVRQTATAGDHPDADLLAGFAEQRLGTAEREQVLTHLASCAECRQVIASSFPAQASVEEPVTDAARERAWHEWWIFRWAGLGAALAVILIAVFLARPRGRTPQEATARADQSETGQAQTSNAAAPALTPPAEPHAPPKRAPAKQKRVPEAKAPETAAPTGRGSGTGITSGAYQAATPRVPAQDTASASAANEAVQPQSSAAQMNAAEPMRPLARDEAAKSQAPGSAGVILRPKMESRAKSTLRPGVAGGMASAQAVAAATRWSISQQGRVQRSSDAGRSWHDAGLPDGTEIRALATMGAEVWAGGPHGMLFHSSDAGDHWIRIPVSAGGQSLTGDITHLELRDRDHLDVISSSGEKWQTVDAGATWKLLMDQR